jgi:hypothetical protein
MKLTFPTQAEQAVTAYETKTVKSITQAATRAGADKEVTYPEFKKQIRWIFDDDSSIVVTGHGKAYRYYTELP